MFLIETKMRSDKVLKLKQKMGFQNGVAVDSVGGSGGLALFWSDEVKLSLKRYFARHIKTMMEGETSDQSWTLTGFYGQPITERCKDSWILLKRLSQGRTTPWVC